MKFDLFDAMACMRQNFGSSGEILLRHDYEGSLVITLQIIHRGRRYRSGFMIPLIEARDSNVNVMNYKFKEAMEKLRHEINATQKVEA